MSRKTGTDRSRDDRKETSALAGKKLSPWLLKLMGDRALPLAHRPLISVTVPPLASHIWQQAGHLRQQSSRLVGWVANYVGCTSLQMARLPTPKSTTLSPVRQRLLDLTWLRRHRKRQSQLSQTLNFTSEKEQRVNAADKLYRNEFPETLRLTDEEQLFSPADELYPMVIKNLLSPPVARIVPPDTTDDSFHPTYATPVYPQIKQIADKPETKDTSESMAPHINPIRIPSLYQADRIHRADHQQVKAQANWQPQRTSQSRWLAGVLPPLTQKSVIYRVPITRSHHIARQSIPWAQAIPTQHRPYRAATREEVETSRQTAMQPTPVYPSNSVEVTNLDDKTIQNLENYAWPVNMEMKTNLPHSLPDQSRLAESRPTLETPSQSSILKTTSSFRKAPFSIPTLDKNSALGLLLTKVIPQQTPEIRQAGQSMPLVNPLPQIGSQKAEAIHISEGAASTAHRPITAPVAIPDNLGLSQERPTSPTETHLTHREYPPAANLHRRPQLVTDVQTLAAPGQQHFKLIDNIPAFDESEKYDFQRKEEKEPSFSRYKHTPRYKDTTQYKDIRQSVLELLLTSVAGPTPSSKATGDGKSLATMFEGTAYYGSQPVPELALAPVESQTGTVPPPTRQEPRTETITGEASTPDINSIARDVYHILKRRLARERERALGLS